MLRATCLIVLLAVVPARGAVGQVSFFLSSACPSGFLPLNGQSVPPTNTELYTMVQGSVTVSNVYLPDVNGALNQFNAPFIRGWDPNGSRAFFTDPVGGQPQPQYDSFQGHKHGVGSGGGSAGWTASLVYAGSTEYSPNGLVLTPRTDGTNGTPRTSAETRPVNYAFLACVQAEVLESGGGTSTVEQVMTVETQNFLFALFFCWLAITGFKMGKGV